MAPSASKKGRTSKIQISSTPEKLGSLHGYGPPTRETGAQCPIAIDDVVATAKIYAMTVLTICDISSRA